MQTRKRRREQDKKTQDYLDDSNRYLVKFYQDSFDDLDNRRLICKICFDVARNALEAVCCEATVCEPCGKRWSQTLDENEEWKCFHCKKLDDEIFDTADLLRISKTKRMIIDQLLKMRCIACDISGTWSSLSKKHLRGHPDFFIACPYCSAEVRRLSLGIHQQTNCPKFFIGCPHLGCGWVTAREEREAHERAHHRHCDDCDQWILSSVFQQHRYLCKKRWMMCLSVPYCRAVFPIERATQHFISAEHAQARQIETQIEKLKNEEDKLGAHEHHPGVYFRLFHSYLSNGEVCFTKEGMALFHEEAGAGGTLLLTAKWTPAEREFCEPSFLMVCMPCAFRGAQHKTGTCQGGLKESEFIDQDYVLLKTGTSVSNWVKLANERVHYNMWTCCRAAKRNDKCFLPLYEAFGISLY